MAKSDRGYFGLVKANKLYPINKPYDKCKTQGPQLVSHEMANVVMAGFNGIVGDNNPILKMELEDALKKYADSNLFFDLKCVKKKRRDGTHTISISYTYKKPKTKK